MFFEGELWSYLLQYAEEKSKADLYNFIIECHQEPRLAIISNSYPFYDFIHHAHCLLCIARKQLTVSERTFFISFNHIPRSPCLSLLNCFHSKFLKENVNQRLIHLRNKQIHQKLTKIQDQDCARHPLLSMRLNWRIH